MMRKAAESRRWSMTSPQQKKIGIALLRRFKRRRQMEKIEKAKVERLGIEDKKGRRVTGHTAEEKCRAVLSVWTERRKAGEVCRELGVTGRSLTLWQEQAMEGMLLALQPRPRVGVEKGGALSPRLGVLFEGKSKGGAMKGLERRLARLQSKSRLNARISGKPGEL